MDGRWVWGEWPAIKSILGTAPRIIAPMQYGKLPHYAAHWLRNGRVTFGSDPVRWAPMIYPIGDEPIPLDQDNALVREGVKHALMHLDLPLAEDNGIVDYD